MKINFNVLGGGNEIGANSFLLSLNEINIVLDSGLHPRKKGSSAFPNYESIKNEKIDHLIITHAHTDHIGSLPYFLKFFPYAKIYSTKATLSLAEVMLSNTTRILREEFELEFDKSMISNYKEETLDIIPMIMKRYDYEEKIHLNDSGNEKISFKFFDAGHILGSASVLINAAGKKIFYTGDINLRNQSLIPKAELPKNKIDILITEATNCASENYPDYKDEEKRLGAFINRIINKGGSVLIPSFALGKSQEILMRVHTLMKKNIIPHVPVYYSPMSKAINDVYDDYIYSINRVKKGFKLSEIDFTLLGRRDSVRGDFYKHPSIVIATSGMMMPRTASYTIAKQFLPRANFGIAVCGYCDPDTPGYLIKNARYNELLYLNSFESPIDVKCEIGNFRFSSHSRKEELEKMIEHLNPDTIIIVHGDENAINSLGNDTVKKYPGKRIIAPEKNRDYKLS
ncbi:MAG: MBL fold metallo-hydrolase [Bacteroidetes bacterium]|nr:MBL fold metallo-hydrolase [Bacteroidota bacterium]